jgi:beta-N-acetylhexosaminidase
MNMTTSFHSTSRNSLCHVLTKVLIATLILSQFIPLNIGHAASHNQSTTPEERAQALLSTLTPEERVGQLFLVTFMGNNIDEESEIFDLITNHHIGGVVLQRNNDNFISPPQTLNGVLDLTREIQTVEWSASQTLQVDILSSEEFTPAFIPLFIAIAQEGDSYPYDQIIDGLTHLPNQMTQGATWQPALAQQVGTVLGRELSALGLTMLMGPSLDVLDTPNPQSTGNLGVRTFGGDPYWVGELGRGFVSGVHEGSGGKIAIIGKHFPGHGSSDRLPEEEVATVRKSLEQLKQIELLPFYAVTGNAPSEAATIDGLLASHIRYQGFQGNIRATTRPVSFDPQAFTQLLDLPEFTTWRENGGLMISDNLGGRAFRRFIDPSGEIFNARFIARDAFLTGNDMLYLGNDFISTGDPESYISILRTLAFFAQKYREDPAFAQRVDVSVFRILTLKYKIYENIFTLDQVLAPEDGISDLGTYDQVTFDIAQQAATIINPSLEELDETLPEPPSQNDRLVFFTDTRTAQQCSDCPEQPIFSKNEFEQAVTRLYGPSAGGQILQSNLASYSYAELEAYLNADQAANISIEENLQRADWIVFSMLDVTSNNPTTQVLSRFLAERPDLFQDKKLIVFAFNAPYFLDATEISKITAYFGLYSKTPKFIDVAARLLFGEIPAPPGDLPVSVPGVGYDLITATSPDPEQTIPLLLDYPEPVVGEETPTPTPTPEPVYRVGDLIPVRTDLILDQNGNQVPDFTPVRFILSGGSDQTLIIQEEVTNRGTANTTFQVDRSGTIEIRVESEPATNSTVLRFDIQPENGTESSPTPTKTPTATPTRETPTPTIAATLVPTPSPAPPDNRTDIGDWLVALLVTASIGAAIYWLTVQYSLVIWGIRGSLLAVTGGLLAYTYLAIGLPGSEVILTNIGNLGVPFVTLIGSGIGWGAARGWQLFENNHNNSPSTQQGGD